jgi:uncharacterized protein (DUF362 family)
VIPGSTEGLGFDMRKTMEAFKLKESPFTHDPSAPKVFVAGGQGAYENTILVLSKIDLGPARGKRVLLKPNAGRMAGPGSGINTNPMAVAAAIDAFRAAGATVALGESPITGVKTSEAFEISGIADVARKRDCLLIDMDERKYVDVALLDGIAIQSIKLCPDILEFDIIVSIPVMKMHMHTGVTLGIKNMKGCLWRRSKVVLHMLPPVEGRSEKPLDIAIADMSYALRPHLTIIDGWVGMEGIGPSAGKPKQLNAAVLGVDAYAADAVACELMGTSARKIPHLNIGADRGFGCIDMEKIDVSPSDWRKWVSPFGAPPTDISIGFPEFDILDLNSCSACQSSLLLFLKGYGDRILSHFPKENKVSVAIGKGHESVPKGCLCIGNCTARMKEQAIYVKGCPPVGSEILRAITGHPTIDDKDANPEENR